MSQDEIEDWEQGKRAHIELSDQAAERYDEVYAKANYATASYMDYELKRLKELVQSSPDKSIAVDLGCGTGRHSFILAQEFEQVYGYDISSGMINAAIRNKSARGVGNVSFEVQDVEMALPSIGEGRAALVSCSFGMGSFIRDLPTLFKTVRMLLKPRGVAAFSWYNSEALVNNLHLEWRPALAARTVPGKRKLSVNFDGQDVLISAVAYDVSQIRHELGKHFSESTITTYPTLTALFPHSLFEDERARELCREVDERLASNVAGPAAGPYIFATARKGGKPVHTEKMGYERVEELLRVHEIAVDRIEHGPFRTMRDVMERFPDVDPKDMVKSVLLARRRGEANDPEHDDLVLALVPASSSVDSRKLATFLGCAKGDLYMASPNMMEERTGFSQGTIPPFGMPRRVHVVMDTHFATRQMLWTGSGKATESFHLSLMDLKILSNCDVADVAKG